MNPTAMGRKRFFSITLTGDYYDPLGNFFLLHPSRISELARFMLSIGGPLCSYRVAITKGSNGTEPEQETSTLRTLSIITTHHVRQEIAARLDTSSSQPGWRKVEKDK